MEIKVETTFLSKSYPVLYEFIMKDYIFPLLPDNITHLDILQTFIKQNNGSPEEVSVAGSFFNMIITTKCLHGDWVLVKTDKEHRKK